MGGGVIAPPVPVPQSFQLLNQSPQVPCGCFSTHGPHQPFPSFNIFKMEANSCSAVTMSGIFDAILVSKFPKSVSACFVSSLTNSFLHSVSAAVKASNAPLFDKSVKIPSHAYPKSRSASLNDFVPFNPCSLIAPAYFLKASIILSISSSLKRASSGGKVKNPRNF